ncbi:hypothetical protein VOLCADRAFT_120498 [Volvox carteri f. nagariensis]|uniref:Exocyst complex component Sec3 C-terminal domain-containing protein n=1 Tax=Volvox carteri f. nagariensis TaxID=3068 RepID=D8TML2_VOLCA|nr:uncharacterized protein VOLCADRAFT_120498 [Volvox carteri f. nagariensis]EFJ51143.1 hypothetical protein VOLCADRAFT_120498 [Volvox carteri f. nagariensis]|eukprot:XP_002947610.1 hypothetical protein VOLCADRAFT_120498 [Volvox carteri f. nagariensis]
MSGKSLVDAGLQREAEALFSNTDEILIAAFCVLKVRQQGESTGAQLLKALGGKTFLAKEAPQPRLLCLTVRRSKQSRSFKPILHTCKPAGEHATTGFPPPPPSVVTAAGGGGGGAGSSTAATAAATAAVAASKSHPLKSITEIVVPAYKYEHNPVHLLELRFSDSGSYSTRGEVVNQFKFRSHEELQLVLALLVNLLRQYSSKLPRFTGADVGEVDTWWLSHQGGVLPALGAFAREVLLPGGGGGAGGVGGGGGGGGARVLLSAKEERDLEELLDMFAMGVGDVAEFEERLAAEHEALEAANVHSIMVAVPAAEAVVAQIRKTQGLLEDLDEYLTVFDTKLRHMREDIAAIESSNNSLELQSRNNTRLLNTLQGLLSDLRLPPDAEAALESPPFGKDSRLVLITRAAWQLASKLRRLDPSAPGCLSLYLLQMRVAQEAREALESLASRFVTRALAHLKAVFNASVEEVVAALAANTDKASRLAPPSHDRLRSAMSRHSELVRVVAALDPAAMARLHAAYCQPMNMLLRKELRVSVAELRKAASLDMQANPIDYSLTSSSMAKAAGVAGSVMGSRGPGGSVVSEGGGERRGRGGGGGGNRGRWSGGGYDPLNMAIPLHEAWQGLLEGYLPHLLAEAEGAAAFLMLRKRDIKGAEGTGRGRKKKGRRRVEEDAAGLAGVSGGGGGGIGGVTALPPPPLPAGGPLTREGRTVEEAMLAGVDAEFMALVDLTAKSHQVLCLPMMSMATQCINALATRGSVALPLRLVLAACHARLRSHFGRFVEHQQAAVESYGVKLAASGSAKSHHVVNFIAQFALMAHHMEVMLTYSIDALLAQLSGGAAAAAEEGGGGGGGSSVTARPAGAGAARSTGTGGGGGSGSDAEDEVEDEETSRRRQLLQTAAGWQVRQEVDAIYAKLVGLMFASLERIAAADSKHGDRLRAENYAYFVEAVRPLVRHVAALEPYMVQAETKQEEAVQRYVAAQLQYTALWRLLEASERIDQLLQVVSPGEVAYQADFSAGEMRSLITTTMKDVDKKVQKMYARVKKHLGNTNLSFRVWERIHEQLIERCKISDDLHTVVNPKRFSNVCGTVPILGASSIFSA